jgi:hypothetical protein
LPANIDEGMEKTILPEKTLAINPSVTFTLVLKMWFLTNQFNKSLDGISGHRSYRNLL